MDMKSLWTSFRIWCSHFH